MQVGPVVYRRPAPRHRPISPPAERGPRGKALPAYVSNGLIGVRVRENPLRAGLCLVNSFSGEHHVRRIEAAAVAPYPLAGDLCLNGVWMSDQPESVRLIDQAYDFETAELTSRFVFAAEGRAARVEVVTFASRTHPTIVCQQVAIDADPGGEIVFRARIDPEGVRGRQLRRRTATPGEPEAVCDGSILWSSEGEMNTCGLALLTGAPAGAQRSQEPWDAQGPLSTSYRLPTGQGRRVFTQLVSLVPSRSHTDPDNEAVRLVAQAGEIGFDEIRRRNRAEWARLWKSRIRLVGAERRWQALADAAFFYLSTSVHPSSPASTSIFGMATWHDYHYYFGHVMWDIDAFAAPCLSLLQPSAADALLDFRTRSIPTARENARFYGRVGLQFGWEASPRNGEETAPGGGAAAHREIHVSLHVARAFALHADATGDERFLRERAWPVLSGVSDWIVDRASQVGDGWGFRELGGIAERAEMIDNDAVTILVAKIVLERALEAARQLGLPEPPRWREVADGLSPPMRTDGVIAAHEGYRADEEKGDTPEPLMALFPYWAPVEEPTVQRTLEFYLSLWRGYVGSPMLAALYGAWAAWAGDRALSLKLLEEGYGAYEYGRFSQTLEYRRDRFPEQTPAGPFIANIGGFLTSLLFGFPGLRPSAEPLSAWPQRPVVLPEGWTAIECDCLWLRDGAVKLVARQGEMARLTPSRA